MEDMTILKRPIDVNKPQVSLNEVRCAADCQKFLVGVLTTPGFREQAMQLVDPAGGFFSDAMTETTMKEFIEVQQGLILDIVPDYTILNWRYVIDGGNIIALKFRATASFCGIPVEAADGTFVQPNGKRVTFTCAWIFTLENGKVIKLEKSF